MERKLLNKNALNRKNTINKFINNALTKYFKIKKIRILINKKFY